MDHLEADGGSRLLGNSIRKSRPAPVPLEVFPTKLKI